MRAATPAPMSAKTAMMPRTHAHVVAFDELFPAAVVVVAFSVVVVVGLSVVVVVGAVVVVVGAMVVDVVVDVVGASLVVVSAANAVIGTRVTPSTMARTAAGFRVAEITRTATTSEV